MISFSGVWVKISHISPTASAFYRVFIGGLFLLGVAIHRREIKWPGSPQRNLLVLCGLFFAVDLVLYHITIMLVGPGLGTILPNFQVFLLTLAGIWFFKERLSKWAIAAIPMAIIGLFLIVGIKWQKLDMSYKIGILCGLGTAVCYSGFLLCLRKLQSDEKESSMFYVIATVSLISVFFIALEMWRSGDRFTIPDGQTLLALLALGLLSQSVGWILITNALPLMRSSLSGLLLLLQPALAFVWDVIIFRRPTSMLNWAGVVITLTAIYLGARAPVGSRKQAPPMRADQP
jgi:drug/metabolite transporter (DMT)-like permease